MLAVAPMDAGRSWGLLSADSSMVDTTRAWIPPTSPTAVSAELQTASPMVQSLPGPRRSLAARRRQSQAPHRKNGGGVTRGNGSWKTTGGGDDDGGGGVVVQVASSAEGAGSAGGGRGGRATTGAGVDSLNACSSSVSSHSHQRSQERASRDEEGSSSRASRTHGDHHRGSSNSGGAGGGTTRVITGRGEAWGTTSTVAAGRAPSDRIHSGGAVSCRGGKSSNAPEAWAWAGVGGGAARGKAMLTAYGLQTDKHNPTCPRGTPGDGVARHGRLQRDQDGCGARKGESGDNTGIEGGGDRCAGVEGDGGSGKRRGRSGGSVGGRTGDTSLDLVSAGQVRWSRGGKGRKQRSSAAPQGRSTTMSDRRPSEDRTASCAASSSSSSSRERQRFVDAAAGGGDGGGRVAGQTSTSTAVTLEDHREQALLVTTTTAAASFDIKPGSRERAPAPAVAGADRRPAEHIQRALEDLLVRPRGSPVSPPNQFGCPAVAEADGALPTTTATSGHVAILSMDGRGGSAAPPYRPQQISLRTVTSASHAPVLPDLGTGTGTGTAGGAGMIAAFDANSGNSRDAAGLGSNSGGGGGDGGGGGGGGGGDGHSTPPVSRQRSHSHHSPWQARKHPRGFPAGRGGAGFGRRHHHSTNHYSHPHERSLLLEERLTPGSMSGGLRCLTSESTERALVVDSASANTAGAMASAATGAQTMVVVSAMSVDDNRESPGGSNVALGPSSELRAGYGRPTSCGNTAAAPPSSRTTVVTVAGGSNAAVATAATTQSELIDHFKMAKRPTSRRGTRKHGSVGGEAGFGGGGDYAPEPAFCLFSRRGVGGGTSVARA
ncbi:unnamed protein product [Pylaiella littoralis]